MDTSTEDIKLTKYFIDNYNSLIQKYTDINFTVLDRETNTYKEDYTYGKDIIDYIGNPPISLNTKLKQHVWIGPKCYNVHYDIYWSIKKFPDANYTECHGDKCRNFIELSFDHWCCSCFPTMEEMDISRIIKLYLTNYDCGYGNICAVLFNEIIKFIKEVKIIEFNEIVELRHVERKPDPLIRANQISWKIDQVSLELKETEQKAAELRKRLENIHNELGFDSKETMDLFLHSARTSEIENNTV
jgi:hypothetical protein